MSSTYNIFIFQKNRQTQCLRWLSAFFAYPSVENGIIPKPLCVVNIFCREFSSSAGASLLFTD